jgi:hypothetical protein
MRWHAVSLLVIGLSLPSAALAAEKSAIESKTPAAKITVTIEKKLQAEAGLPADLLAEGQRFVAKARAEAEGEYKANREDFRGGRRWTYERSYRFRSLVAGRYLSILRDDGTYTGGAHPNTLIDTILWDRTQRKRISIRPFFSEMADNGPTMTALAKLVRRAVAAEKRERWKEARPDDEKSDPLLSAEELAEKDDQLKQRVAPRLTKIGPITLAPSTIAGKSSGLTVHYSPYDVDAYAAGPYTVFVPWTALRPYLSPEGGAIFGGERPKGDVEER